MKKNKLKTRDLIYSGAFAALYIITVFIIVMAFSMIPLLYLMSPLFVGMIGATIYMMYVSKIKKFGCILILATLFGLIMSSSGHGLCILICTPLGLIADLIAKSGGYTSKKMLALSYVVFNFTMVAPFYNLYFASQKFINESIQYYGSEYGDALSTILNTWGFGLLAIQTVTAIIGAMVGVIISNKLFKKHFVKAGLV